MEKRNEAFQRVSVSSAYGMFSSRAYRVQLKPTCISLSQSILAFSGRHRNVDSIIQDLQNLSKALEDITTHPEAFDHRLADYVFFPISQLLKASQNLPVQAMEACLQCLSILLSKGWKNKIDMSLSGQLVIFLTLTCDTSGKTVPAPLATDELRTAGFRCLRGLFDSLSTTSVGKSSLVGTTNVPSLGHAVSVILEGIVNGESLQVQLAAAHALQALISCIEDPETLSSFLPGMISSWTKALTPTTKSRRHWKLLVVGLHNVESLLQALLSDRVVDEIISLTDQKAAMANEQKMAKMDSSWVKATASQLKVAIANINRLRSHERAEVQEAVLDLNMTLLSECSHALVDSCALAAETVLLLVQGDSNLPCRDKITALAQNNASISELLATVFRNEQLSLVRIMQSNDGQAKERSLGKLFGAYTILATTEIDMSIISRMLSSGLRDGVTAILQQSVDRNAKTSRITPISISDITLRTSQKSSSFTSPLAEYKAQEDMLEYMSQRIKTLKGSNSSLKLASNLMPALRTSDKTTQLATFWLVLQDLSNSNDNNDEVDGFMSAVLVGDLYSNDQSISLREQLYSFSLEILEDDDSADWRLKSLALEAVALHAQRQGVEFRGELVDALYPILHHLGSESGNVRDHAMKCLDVVANACEYADAGELIVSNVDYLVNAVALKLNAFDVSPQGPQVLLMMVRLAGPSLLPYLEDTLESIFAALEDYHGYTTLVELLFAVLRTMAEEGVKAPMLCIDDGKGAQKKDSSRWKPTELAELVDILKGLSQRQTDTDSDLLDPPPANRPDQEINNDGKDKLADTPSDEPTPPPAPKTYALLLKITQLTQHYLTSSSPTLRTSLFSLLHTTIPTLAKHENSFLPLVNTLWPEITLRLFDDETHVVAGSLQIIGCMCEYAGTFMRTRVDSLWPELVGLHRRLLRDMATGMPTINPGSNKADKQRHGRDEGMLTTTTTTSLDNTYIDTSTRALWQSLQDLLVLIVQHVEVEAEKFDDVLRMMGPMSQVPEHVRVVLEECNADAVWLARYRAQPWKLETPKRSSFAFAQAV
jgi:hypothetical protein